MRSVLWVLASMSAGRLLSVAGLAVLARWLAPAEFGLLAFALVYITYVETVGDLGAGMALVYWPSRRHDAAQVAFALNMATGLVWLALTLAAAPAVAAFFGNPAGEAILRTLAWSFPLKALGNTHDALCQKELRFKARVVPELGLAAAKTAVALALAASGFGVWSLVWGQLAGTALWTALLWTVVPWRPRWHWPHGLLAPMLSYGRGIVAVNVLAAIVHRADLVVVGRMLGPTALGLYHVASKVPEMTITMVMWAVSRVLFPALSRARTEGRPAAATYLTSLRYSSLLTVPAAVALALLADPLVLVLFGSRWTGAAPVLRALAVAAGLRSMGSQAGDVLKAAGRPGLLAGLGALRALLLVPAMVIAAPAGPGAVAWVMAAVTGATMLLNIGAASRVGRVPLRDVGGALKDGVLAGGMVGACLWAWTALAGPARHPLALAATLAAGAAGYLAALCVASPDAFFRVLGGAALSGADGAAAAMAGPFLVPLEPRLLRYFHRSLLVPYRGRERLSRHLPLALGARLSIDCGRRPPPAAAALSAALARADSGLLRDTPLEGRAGLRAIVAHHATAAGGDRMVAFIFEEVGRQPIAVLKARPVDAARPSLRNEWEALVRAAALPPFLAATVPAALAFREHDGTELLLQAFIPGRSAYAEMYVQPWRRGANVRQHFEEAARWLARFHSATRIDEARGAPVGAGPRSAGHGDFWARNVLWHDGRLVGVVDWEGYRAQAAPDEDLFQFPLTYGLSQPWSRRRETPPEEAFRLTFLAENRVSRAVAGYFAIYCAESGLPVPALPSLFAAYLEGWSSRPGPDGRRRPPLHDLLPGSGPSMFASLAAAGHGQVKLEGVPA